MIKFKIDMKFKFLLLFILTFSIFHIQAQDQESIKNTVVKKGDQAFNYKGQDLENNTYELSQFKGKHVLMVFTLTDYGIGTKLTELNQKYKEELVIILVHDTKYEKSSYEEGEDIFGIRYDGINIWTAEDKMGQRKKYGVNSWTPHYFLIGPDGIVQDVWNGRDWNGLMAWGYLEATLKEHLE